MHCTSWYRQTVTYCNWKKRCVTSVSLESLEGKSVHGSKMVKSLVFWCHKWSKQTKSGDGHLLNSSSIWKKLIGPRKMVGFWTNSAATKSWFKKKKQSYLSASPNHQAKFWHPTCCWKQMSKRERNSKTPKGRPTGEGSWPTRGPVRERPLGKAGGNLGINQLSQGATPVSWSWSWCFQWSWNYKPKKN